MTLQATTDVGGNSIIVFLVDLSADFKIHYNVLDKLGITAEVQSELTDKINQAHRDQTTMYMIRNGSIVPAAFDNTLGKGEAHAIQVIKKLLSQPVRSLLSFPSLALVY
jgi:predicted nucleic acid-binding protein